MGQHKLKGRRTAGRRRAEAPWLILVNDVLKGDISLNAPSLEETSETNRVLPLCQAAAGEHVAHWPFTQICTYWHVVFPLIESETKQEALPAAAPTISIAIFISVVLSI